GGGCLVACEVDGGVVITLVLGPALAAGPVLGPADVLLVHAQVTQFGRWVPAAGHDEPGAVPAGFVAQLPPRFCQGRIGEAAASGLGSGEPCWRSIPAASSPSTTMVPWVLASLVVNTWMWCARMSATRR